MKIWLVIVGVGLVSLLLRSSFLVILRGRHLPERVTSSLGLVPAAVLAARASDPEGPAGQARATSAP